jgi:hypothetical protein
VWRKEVSFFLLLEANLSPLFPWPTFPHIKINKKNLQNQKIPLKGLKLHPHHGQKERKKERGKGEGGKRRSQKNSKEKIGCKFYELKSFKLHLPP